MVFFGEIFNVFVDNVYYYNSGFSGWLELIEVVLILMVDVVDVVLLFSNVYDDVLVDIWFVDWDVV